MTRTKTKIDASLAAYGSVWLLHPYTQAAKDWITENVGGEQTWLGSNLGIEHRFVENIYQGLTEAGLTVFVAT